MFPRRKTMIIIAILLAAAIMLSGCGGPAHCSAEWLILAINNANSNGPGVDTIDLAPGCVYELGVVDNTIDGNNGLPSVTTSIIINGHGATIRRSTQAQKSAIRLFHVSQGGDLTLSDLTLLDGLAMEPPDISLLTENSGGAIYNAGNLTVNGVLITANRATQKGGGIYNVGTMTITGSTIQNNEVNISNAPGESGGGILNTGTATITDSAIINNLASQSGGGIGNSGTMTVSNSTISGNSTTLNNIASGAAIMNAGSLEIGYTTVANNVGTTSGAIFSAPDTITIYNTIVAYNSPANCSYPLTSMILGPNIDSDGTCDAMLLDDPLLDPLANNGGTTKTHAIPANSPARDAAFGLFPPMDQRGVPRPHGPAADIGSYEFNGGQPQGDSSFVSGLVFDDLNADGILDPGETGFTGVELVLETGPCLAPVSSVSALTAPDGTFQFQITPPTAGTYCLSIDPLTPPNDTILIPGGFTIPLGGQLEFTLTEGEDLSGLLFGWDFQFAGSDIQPKVEITNVVLSTTTPPEGGFVEVEVTVENSGAYPAEDYELVLIPHYGWGPPNPGGYVALPDLMPGVPHTEVFSPGVLYSPAGTYILRVLVTDDWYALGDPDSTGTAGDYQDFTITVLPSLSFCFPFLDMDLSLVLLNIQEPSLLLPLYLKTEGAGVPGLVPAQDPPVVYQATLGQVGSNICGLQGFEDRLYCTFNLTPEMPGTTVEVKFYVEGCEDPAYVQKVLLPELKRVCSQDLGKSACQEAGGTYVDSAVRSPYCECP